MSKSTVIIVGASADRSKYGNKSVRAHLQQGWDVFPVNPKQSEIEGVKTYSSLSAIPKMHVNRISMYVPPNVGITLLAEIAALNPDEVWFNPGSESPELMERAEQLGLEIITACSIVDLGATPAEFPE